MKTFAIVQSHSEEQVTFEVDNVAVGWFSYDMHGSAAMDDAATMFVKIAGLVGAHVVTKMEGVNEQG